MIRGDIKGGSTTLLAYEGQKELDGLIGTDAEDDDPLAIFNATAVLFFFDDEIVVRCLGGRRFVGELIRAALCAAAGQKRCNRIELVTIGARAVEIETNCIDFLARLPLQVDPITDACCDKTGDNGRRGWGRARRRGGGWCCGW